MSDKDLVEYFIEQTNYRFEKLEKSINLLRDDLISLKHYKWFLMGIATGISTLITGGYHIFFK